MKPDAIRWNLDRAKERLDGALDALNKLPAAERSQVFQRKLESATMTLGEVIALYAISISRPDDEP